jgi:hypothetical protein
MSRIEAWSEKLSLRPFEITPSVCCLEPNEAISITLTATNPISAEVLDWRSYRRWERGKPLKSGVRLVRRFKQTASAEDPPYTVVLLITNPGTEGADVFVEIASELDAVNGARLQS